MDSKEQIQIADGIITKDTKFAKSRRGTIGFKYKNWTQKNEVRYESKGNEPLLYEEEFLKTLTAVDFEGLELVEKSEEIIKKEKFEEYLKSDETTGSDENDTRSLDNSYAWKNEGIEIKDEDKEAECWVCNTRYNHVCIDKGGILGTCNNCDSQRWIISPTEMDKLKSGKKKIIYNGEEKIVNR